MPKKKILITGATGFFGRSIVPHLAARNFHVRAATRRDVNLGKSVEVINVGDLEQNIDWARHVDGMDAVVHLAGLAHVTSIIPEVEYDKINRQATLHLAKAADAVGAKFIFVSSIAAQSGPSAKYILTEESPPSPTTAYGRSKLRAEQEIAASVSRYVILRPTLTYGNGVMGNMSRIVRLATFRIPPPFGQIRNQRSLLSIDNMCDAVEFVFKSDTTLNQLFIVSDTEPVSMSEIVIQLRAGAGLGHKGLSVPPEVLHRVLWLLRRRELWEKIAGNLVVSISKLKRFGFRWRISTHQGLRALGAAHMAELASKSTERATFENV